MSIYLDSKQDEKEKTSEDDPYFPSAQQPPPPLSNKNQDGVQDHGDGRMTADGAKDQRIQSIKRARSSHSRGSRRYLLKIKKQQVLDKERERKKLGAMVASLGNT